MFLLTTQPCHEIFSCSDIFCPPLSWNISNQFFILVRFVIFCHSREVVDVFIVASQLCHELPQTNLLNQMILVSCPEFSLINLVNLIFFVPLSWIISDQSSYADVSCHFQSLVLGC